MLKFKVSFQDDIRRFDPSVQERTEIATLFESLKKFVNASFLVREPFLLKYIDDEGELITIAHASELDEAIRIAAEEGRKSLKIIVVGQAAPEAPVAPEAKLEPELPAENVSEVPQDDAESGAPEEESDRPTCEEIRDLFNLFLEDEEVKAVLPEAIKVFLASLKEQQAAGNAPSTVPAFEAVFSAYPVIRDHEFIQSVVDKIPLVAEKLDRFAPIVANLDADFVASFIPQALSMAENFRNGGMAAFGPFMAHFMGGMGGQGMGGGPTGGCGMGPGMGMGGMGGHPMAQMFANMMGGAQGMGGAFGAQDDAAPEGDEKGEVVHEGVACDLCGVQPIVGIRFKCAECPNFDLCSECEAKGDPAAFVGGDHTLRHVMIKMRKGAPRRFFNSRFPWRGRGHGHRGWRRGNCGRRGPNGGGCRKWKMDGKKDGKCGRKDGKCGRKDPKFKGASVEHVTLPDGSVVLAGQKTTKIWSIKNNGEVAWPEGTVIQHMKGDRFAAFEAAVGACAPGETIQIVLDLEALNVPGTYSAKYRLKTPKEHGGRKFGRPLWVNIEVVADQVPEDELKVSAPEEPAQEPAPLAFEDALPVEEPVLVPPPAQEPAQVPLVEEPAFVPEQPGVFPELEYKYQDSLNALVGMGFGNIEVNKALLNQHNGNVARALEDILAQ